MDLDFDELNVVFSRYPATPDSLISLLADMQEMFHYLPEHALILLSERLDVPLSRVYSVATFYNAFSLEPRGEHLVSVCLGTACHVKGAENILSRLERELGVGAGHTTEDMMFSLEKVRCIGCCSLAPVIRVDEDTYGHLEAGKVPSVLKKYRRAASKQLESVRAR